MEYAELVAAFEALEATSSTHEKRDVLAELFAGLAADQLPVVVKLARGKVFAPWESGELGVSTSLAREAIAKATGIDEDEIEDWWREAGDLGSAAERAVAGRTQRTLFSEPLTTDRVYETLREAAGYEGEGSQGRRVDAIASLVSDADPAEARYVVRTVAGAMRLGIGEGTVRDAIAAAYLDGSGEAVAAVERGYEVTSDFATVAERAREDGVAGLEELGVEPFRPVKPMLAGTADGLEEALEELTGDGRPALLETKYDGLRAKIHGSEGEVRLFTRRLEEVTDQFPEAVAAADERIDADAFVLEGELVGYDPDSGEPVPFQELSRRIRRKHDVEAVAAEVPATLHTFDALSVGDESLLSEPLERRLDVLEGVFEPAPGRIERADHERTASVADAEAFYEAALAAGHEGVMVKNLAAAYQPGSRVGYQLKVKPTMEPLDLVVTRAKWSEGRKSDFLGRPYLACRGPGGSLLEVGRMHTGFTDEQLEEFTALVEPLVQSVEGREADLRPEVVLEVEYEEIQESSTYDSGYALRFPRLSRIRTDLGPEDADTFERVEALYESQ